jgi:pyruvate formate lyase activating enzyme
MTGTIFNIQRYSINDGPGIRTTVFLKGCPLHCKWCHNPESISPEKEVLLREDRCIRCGDCSISCEQDAIQRDDDGFITDREKCIQCGNCIDVCFAEARILVGNEMTADEVITEILKDELFYTESNGGVTFSGGEPFLQHEFLYLLLAKCKQHNIHTAVDTTGYTSVEILQRSINFIDLFLYDIKTMNDAVHKSFTGVSNKLILENLKKLSEWQKNIIIRIPIIRGINDNLEEIRNIGVFVESLRNISEIHLLPYHKTGIEKYQRLGLDFQINNMEPPGAETIEMIAKELKKHVQIVKIGG